MSGRGIDFNFNFAIERGESGEKLLGNDRLNNAGKLALWNKSGNTNEGPSPLVSLSQSLLG